MLIKNKIIITLKNLLHFIIINNLYLPLKKNNNKHKSYIIKLKKQVLDISGKNY